jgi:hypothetical protein
LSASDDCSHKGKRAISDAFWHRTGGAKTLHKAVSSRGRRRKKKGKKGKRKKKAAAPASLVPLCPVSTSHVAGNGRRLRQNPPAPFRIFSLPAEAVMASRAKRGKFKIPRVCQGASCPARKPAGWMAAVADAHGYPALLTAVGVNASPGFLIKASDRNLGSQTHSRPDSCC